MTRVLLTSSLLLLQFLTPGSMPPGTIKLDVKGEFTEPLSQLSFPERLLGWERSAVMRFPEPAGHSVTYEYKDQKAQARATVFVYPHVEGMPTTLPAHFAGILSELRTLRPDLEVVTETTYLVKKDDRVMQLQMVTLLYRAGYEPIREPVISFLILGKVRDYWLKWRISLPASKSDGIELDELVSAFVPR